MTRARLVTLLVVGCVITTGCAGHRLVHLDAQLANLVLQLNELEPDSSQAQARQEALAHLANTAAAEAAKSAKRDPVMAVAYYRVACVAAWRAHSTSVGRLSSEGAAMCARLPAQDDSAPRDCAEIKLSEPFAVYEVLLRKTSQFDAKLQELRRHDAPALLPVADADPIAKTLFGLAAQYHKVSDIRAAMSNAVPAELKRRTDHDRLAIYCAARKTSDLGANVQGATLESVQTQTDKVREMEQHYRSISGHLPDCRSL